MFLFNVIISDGRKFIINIDEQLYPQINGYQVLTAPDGVFVGNFNESQLTGGGGSIVPVIPGPGGLEINNFGGVSPGINVGDLQLQLPTNQDQLPSDQKLLNINVLEGAGGLPTG